jgi:hypothetical protein
VEGVEGFKLEKSESCKVEGVEGCNEISFTLSIYYIKISLVFIRVIYN